MEKLFYICKWLPCNKLSLSELHDAIFIPSLISRPQYAVCSLSFILRSCVCPSNTCWMQDLWVQKAAAFTDCHELAQLHNTTSVLLSLCATVPVWSLPPCADTDTDAVFVRDPSLLLQILLCVLSFLSTLMLPVCSFPFLCRLCRGFSPHYLCSVSTDSSPPFWYL